MEAGFRGQNRAGVIRPPGPVSAGSAGSPCGSWRRRPALGRGSPVHLVSRKQKKLTVLPAPAWGREQLSAGEELLFSRATDSLPGTRGGLGDERFHQEGDQSREAPAACLTPTPPQPQRPSLRASAPGCSLSRRTEFQDHREFSFKSKALSFFGLLSCQCNFASHFEIFWAVVLPHSFLPQFCYISPGKSSRQLEVHTHTHTHTDVHIYTCTHTPTDIACQMYYFVFFHLFL